MRRWVPIVFAVLVAGCLEIQVRSLPAETSADDAPALRLEADRERIEAGESVFLTWSGQGLDRCRAEGAGGAAAPGGDGGRLLAHRVAAVGRVCLPGRRPGRRPRRDGRPGGPGRRGPAVDGDAEVRGSWAVTVPAGGATIDLPAPRVVRVGPQGDYATLAEAARAVENGTVVEIAAGEYVDDVAVWPQKGLVLRGVGGSVRVRAEKEIGYRPGDDQANGKGIFVLRGEDIRIEHLELSGARVPDRNGAGIRIDPVARRITLCDVALHDNENGLLGSANDLRIEHSRFYDKRHPRRRRTRDQHHPQPLRRRRRAPGLLRQRIGTRPHRPQPQIPRPPHGDPLQRPRRRGHGHRQLCGGHPRRRRGPRSGQRVAQGAPQRKRAPAGLRPRSSFPWLPRPPSCVCTTTSSWAPPSASRGSPRKWRSGATSMARTPTWWTPTPSTSAPGTAGEPWVRAGRRRLRRPLSQRLNST